jgi:hypothetical protein
MVEETRIVIFSSSCNVINIIIVIAISSKGSLIHSNKSNINRTPLAF